MVNGHHRSMAEWDKVWSRLSANFQPFFSLALTGSLPVSLWLSVTHTLALTATLWHTLALYGSLISRIQSLISSQGPCSALSAAATLTHFLPLWIALILGVIDGMFGPRKWHEFGVNVVNLGYCTNCEITKRPLSSLKCRYM